MPVLGFGMVIPQRRARSWLSRSMLAGDQHALHELRAMAGL